MSGEIVCPITAMFDIDDEPTDDPEQAFSAIILLPNNEVMAVKCERHKIFEREVN